MKNRLSVLMSVYKNDPVGQFQDAFESILRQSVRPDQIVLVRDGQVPEALQQRLDRLKVEYPALVKVVELEQNVGLSRALNIGIDHCDHEIIARMDADDISLGTRFFEQMSVLERDPSIALLSAWVDQYNEDMTVLRTARKVPERHEEIVRYAKRRTPFNHTCCIFRKDAALRVGKYPDLTSYCEDWWLALRLIKNGYRLHNVQQSLLKMRTGKDFYKRRAGLRYLRIEIVNIYKMYKEKLISFPDFIGNLAIRVPVRVLPDAVVELFYRKMNRHGAADGGC